MPFLALLAACVRADAATDLAALLDFGSLKIFEACDATLLDVVSPFFAIGASRDYRPYADLALSLSSCSQGSGDLWDIRLPSRANGLGTDYESTITFGVQFGPRQHSGAVAARNLAYVDSCTCYRYTGPPFRR